MIVKVANALKVIFEKLKSAIAAGLVIGIILAVINTYVNVKLQTRTAIESDFTLFKTTSTDLFQVLSKYSREATGTSTSIPEDVKERLNNDVLTLFKVGQAIASRKPTLKPDFESYDKHLMDLKESIDKLSGPYNGKGFVEEVSSYLVAEEQFKDKVNAEQSGYLSLLSLN